MLQNLSSAAVVIGALRVKHATKFDNMLYSSKQVADLLPDPSCN